MDGYLYCNIQWCKKRRIIGDRILYSMKQSTNKTNKPSLTYMKIITGSLYILKTGTENCIIWQQIVHLAVYSLLSIISPKRCQKLDNSKTNAATGFSSAANHANHPTNRRNHENSTSFANDKLYNCRGNKSKEEGPQRSQDIAAVFGTAGHGIEAHRARLICILFL